MEQIVVAQSEQGIVLAAVNRAAQLDDQGQEISFPVSRLLQVGSHAAILTAGAAEGIGMAGSLKRFIEKEELDDVQELYGATLAFLSSEYERFMRKRCEWLPVDPIHQVSFILAGRTMKDETMPFRLYYLWTKKKLPQLDGDQITHAFSLPRRMGLEFQLNRMCEERVPLKEIVKRVAEAMERLRGQGEVRAPVSFALITQEGFQSLNP